MQQVSVDRYTDTMMLGDMNATLQELPCAFALHASGWADLGGDQPTCAAGSLPKRIDWALANPAM